MSDHIAHIGICDDTFRLAAVHPAIHPNFKRLMVEHREAAHMGSITRSADKWSVDLVGWARDEFAKPGGERAQNADAKLAFTLGSLTHRSADRLTKPITRCWSGNDDSGRRGSEANESKIYQDVFVYKEVYASGHAPDAAGLFAPNFFDIVPDSALAGPEALYRLLLRRALIAMHTLNPDANHIHDWLDRFFAGMQTYPKSLAQYAEINATWPKDKVDKYLTSKRFYDRSDALIQLARAAQTGKAIDGGAVVDAQQATTERNSRYGRALAKALDYLIAATEYFEGRTDAVTTAKRFDIGVPELSLQD
ncbi:MAG TPA: hypothetical protein VGN72_17160 [Tepidisphaeraceae bacterium]|jgi:hypothetical protein|nr:hypothetical protein [Tepidisphaeraceae bacterium]